jgi:hypothetical protein
MSQCITTLQPILNFRGSLNRLVQQKLGALAAAHESGTAKRMLQAKTSSIRGATCG